MSWPALACVAVVVALTTSALAQRVPPHIGFAYPAGGQQGTTFTVSIGGQNLNGATRAYVTGAGVTVQITGYDRPMTQKEFSDLREKIQALMEKRAAALGLPNPIRTNLEQKKSADKQTKSATVVPAPAMPAKPGSAEVGKAESGRESTATPATSEPTGAPRPTWTPTDEKTLLELRAQMARRPNRQGNPAISETVTLEVKAATDAPPGDRDLRLQTPAGLSNPILLQIGQLSEFTKPVVTATSNPEPRAYRDPNARPTRPQPADPEITLPTIVNGQIMPGEVDRYRFAAKKGQHLTVEVNARGLIPYLADAVPGWFQATLALYDPQGREVAYGDSFRFSPDPVVSYEIPADGNYAIEIKDSIYRGREDFVYRIAIGELPFVTSIFPLGGRVADPASFELSGWNLPGKTLQVDTADKSPGTFLLSIRERGQLSNAVRFELENEPNVREAEPNNRPDAAQPLPWPIVVDGRIQSPGDEDVFRIEGKAGETMTAEVFARRLGSPLDSTLRLTDRAGRQLAFNDDYEDKGAGLMTHHADSRIDLKLPSDGVYYLRVADAQHHGGPEYGYRLRVRAPHPDFELRVVPSGINVRAGAQVPITVYALRHDDFAGEIVLAFDGAPPGFALSGARIPAGQDKIPLTLSVPPATADAVLPVSIVGAATIGGHTVAHAAVPADDMMQAFAYHHLVVAKELLVDISGPRGAYLRLVDRSPLRIPAGGSTRFALNVPAARTLKGVSIELNDPPEGVTVKSSSSNAAGVVEVTLSTDAAKIKPGLAGNLIVNVFGERTNPNGKGPQRVQRWQIGTAPAIPFEIVAPAANTVAESKVPAGVAASPAAPVR